jgi:hypothetical protein
MKTVELPNEICRRAETMHDAENATEAHIFMPLYPKQNSAL